MAQMLAVTTVYLPMPRLHTTHIVQQDGKGNCQELHLEQAQAEDREIGISSFQQPIETVILLHTASSMPTINYRV
jgi:ribosomal protein L44E